MAKKQTPFTPIADAFKEKLMEAIQQENKGEAIKKAVDEFVAEMGATAKKFNNRSK
ncbi:hypothetical protein V6C27_05025 [Peptococcaceae bacterium 1198_IL3148]